MSERHTEIAETIYKCLCLFGQPYRGKVKGIICRGREWNQCRISVEKSMPNMIN